MTGLPRWMVFWQGEAFTHCSATPDEAAKQMLKTYRDKMRDGQVIHVFPANKRYTYHVRQDEPTLEADLYYKVIKDDDVGKGLDP